MYDKKTIICEIPKHVLYFINKYGINNDYIYSGIMESLIELSEKSMYDITNGLVYENIIEYFTLLNLPKDIDIINDYITMLNAVMNDLILIIVHNNINGSVKHIISMNDYKYILETYRI